MTRFSPLLGSGLVVAAGTRDEGRGAAIAALASGYAPDQTQEQDEDQAKPASGSMLAVDNAARGRGNGVTHS